MDQNLVPKKEQPKEVIASQPEVVSAPVPETPPVVEVGGEVTEVTEATKVTEDVKEETKQIEQPLQPPPAPVAIARPLKDRLTQEIEEVMEEDLKELYLAMPKEKQIAFKQKGEETLSKVRQLLQAAHVNVKKIFQLIRDWLKIIPGVNRYFLEQEAKIKTDKILLVSEEEKKRGL